MNFVIGGKLCVGLDPAGERGHEFWRKVVCAHWREAPKF